MYLHASHSHVTRSELIPEYFREGVFSTNLGEKKNPVHISPFRTEAVDAWNIALKIKGYNGKSMDECLGANRIKCAVATGLQQHIFVE